MKEYAPVANIPITTQAVVSSFNLESKGTVSQMPAPVIFSPFDIK
jgi:hypothetical protein